MLQQVVGMKHNCLVHLKHYRLNTKLTRVGVYNVREENPMNLGSDVGCIFRYESALT